MQKASEALIGEHDFSAFCNERSLCTKETIRVIHNIEITPLSYCRLKISIAGNHFLYKMVRNIAGTLAYIGCAKIAPEDLSEILISKDRKQAGVTAPAHGLTLKEVFYAEAPKLSPAFSGEKL